MDWLEILKKLQAPFNYSDVKFRVQVAPKGSGLEGEGLVLAYVSNRAIQNRFDEVFGVNGWKNEFKEWHDTKPNIKPEDFLKVSEDVLYSYGDKKGQVMKKASKVANQKFNDFHTPSQLCGISVYDEDKKEWITKWDGADGTNFEETKGGLSDSQKRAAYQWGVGRYLYDLKAMKAKLKRNDTYGTWYIAENPPLPEWAIDQGTVKAYHVTSLIKKIATKDVTEEKVMAGYFKENFESFTIKEYESAMKRLNKMDDIKNEKA